MVDEGTRGDAAAAWRSALQLFDGDLQRRGSAEKTRQAYGADLGQFAVWCVRQDLPPEAVTVKILRRYAAVLSEHRHAPTTVARKLAALRAFYRTLREHGRVAGALLARGLEVIGLDVSGRMLALAHGRHPGLLLAQVPGQDLACVRSGSVDAVLAHYAAPGAELAASSLDYAVDAAQRSLALTCAGEVLQRAGKLAEAKAALNQALSVAAAADIEHDAVAGRLLERVSRALGRPEDLLARPIRGAGFGTSPTLDRHPVAAEVSPPRRALLAVGHPHNAPLQAWTETGAIGVALLTVAGLVALAGGAAFYSVAGDAGNSASCRAARPLAAAMAPLARGEVAAVQVHASPMPTPVRGSPTSPTPSRPPA